MAHDEIKLDELVLVPIKVPIYKNGECVDAAVNMVGAWTKRVMPDGRIEVKFQQGGGGKYHPSEIKRRGV